MVQFDQYFSKVSERAKGIMEWLLAVVEEGEPFSMVEKPWFRRNCKMQSISRPFLMKMLTRVSDLVNGKIKKILPKSFGIAFDGWTETGTHYVAVFSLHCSNKLKC